MAFSGVSWAATQRGLSALRQRLPLDAVFVNEADDLGKGRRVGAVVPTLEPVLIRGRGVGGHVVQRDRRRRNDRSRDRDRGVAERRGLVNARSVLADLQAGARVVVRAVLVPDDGQQMAVIGHVLHGEVAPAVRDQRLELNGVVRLRLDAEKAGEHEIDEARVIVVLAEIRGVVDPLPGVAVGGLGDVRHAVLVLQGGELAEQRVVGLLGDVGLRRVVLQQIRETGEDHAGVERPARPVPVTAVGVVVVLRGGERLEVEIRVRADAVEKCAPVPLENFNVFAPVCIGTWTVTTCELANVPDAFVAG